MGTLQEPVRERSKLESTGETDMEKAGRFIRDRLNAEG